MPRVALVLVLLTACGAPELQPLHEAKKREADKPPPTPTPPPAPEPEPEPEPFRRAGDPKQQRDLLQFWGFSADGLRYAFETYDHGPGAVKCEGEASLFIVDAEQDSFVDGLPLILKHKQPDAERCDPPDLRAELDRHRDELFHRHGIIVGNQGPAIVPRPAVTTSGSGRSSTLDLPSGKQLRAQLEVLDGDREKVGERGAAYRLTLAPAGPVDHADQWQPIFMRHCLALHELTVQRRIGRAAAHGEIVGRGDDRPPVDICAPENEVARRQVFQLAVGAIFSAPRDFPDLAKAACIDDAREPRPRIQLAATMLPRDLFLAAHLLGHRAARGEFVDFFFPTHAAKAILR